MLREVATKDVYEDSSEFAATVLHPAVEVGSSIYLVTSWVPSYLRGLLRRLASTLAVEPGNVNVVLCIPFGAEFANGPVRALAAYISHLAETREEVEQFLVDVRELASEGSLSISAIYTPQDIIVTRGCVGLIEHSSPSGSSSITFLDELAGDLNSPIKHRASWSSEPKTHDANLELIREIFFSTPTGMLRVSHDELLTTLFEIEKKHWIRPLFPSAPKSKPESSKRKPTVQKGFFEETDEDDEDTIWHGELRSVEDILRGIEATGLDGETFVSTYFGHDPDGGLADYFDE
jgi:hypothetical protein